MKIELFGKPFLNVERRSDVSSIKNPKEWLTKIFGLETSSGVNVNEETATSFSAVWACTRILSEDIASLPLGVYKKDKNGNRYVAKDHPNYRILHNEPNHLMTSFVWRETSQAHLSLWGNAYSVISFNNAGRAVQLNPVHPRDVEQTTIFNTDSGETELFYKIKGFEVPLPAWQVLHIPGLSFDGLKGKSPLTIYRENVGTAIAAQKYAGSTFKSGGGKRIAIVTNSKLKKEQKDQYKNDWKSKYGGVDNLAEPAIIEGGIDIKEIGMNPADAQLIESRKFEVNEVARIFRIPPHKLGDLDRATFSNIEHQGIDYVTNTLRPWLVRWEQELNRKLFRTDEKETYYTEFNVDALLRGDIKSRYEAYAIARQNLFMNADDILELENRNPLPNGQGKTYINPTNGVTPKGITKVNEKETKDE